MQIEVGAVRIRMVVAEEGCEREASARGILQVEARRRDEAGCERALVRERAGLRKPAAFGAHAPRKLVLDRRIGLFVLLVLLAAGVGVDGEDGDGS